MARCNGLSLWSRLLLFPSVVFAVRRETRLAEASQDQQITPRPEDVPSFPTTDKSKKNRRNLVANGGSMVQMMVGDAIGDAFGFMIEFEDAYWIRANVDIDGRKKWPLRSYLPRWYPAAVNYKGMLGMYSDDAEMTVGLMKALMKCGQDINETCMLDTWKEEWDLSGKRPMKAGMEDEGTVKRSGHGSIIKYYQGNATIDEVRASQRTKTYPGNAPPMRSLPLGFLPSDKREAACQANALASHPHKKASAASFLIAAAVDFLVVQKGDAKQVIEFTMAALKSSSLSDEETLAHLGKIQDMPDWHDYGDRFLNMPPDVHDFLVGQGPLRNYTDGYFYRPRYGLGSDSMRTAGVVLYVAKWQRNPREALLAAVDVGGDVDSTAALVLGLVGGSTGLRLGERDGIPWWMVETVEGVEYLHARATEFDNWVGAPPSPTEVPAFAVSAKDKKNRRQLVAKGGPVVQLMIGDAIGDAFGFMIEMEDADWIRNNVHIDDASFWPLRSYTPTWAAQTANYKDMLGMYSDDAEMTVALMQALLKCGEDINEECMLESWKEEWDLSGKRIRKAGTRHAGAVKRSGHGSISKWFKGKATIEEVRQSQKNKTYPGNAPPMRSLPLGFLAKDKREAACQANAKASHPHAKASAASFLIATAVDWLVVQKGDAKQVIEMSIAALKSSSLAEEETLAHLEKVEALPDWHEYGDRWLNMPPDVHQSLVGQGPLKNYTDGCFNRPRYGLGSDSMRTAGAVLYVMKWQRNPREALLAAVDIGGDVDSTAALVLGLVGGSTGLRLGQQDGIPWWMVETVEGVEYLHAHATEFGARFAAKPKMPDVPHIVHMK